MRVFYLYVYIVLIYIIIKIFFNPNFRFLRLILFLNFNISLKILFEYNAIDDKTFTTMTSFLDLLPQTDCEIAFTIGIC